MWSKIVLLLLVGLAYASNNPGWTDNQEYVYKIRGRTLTGLMEVSNQYAGILFRATLRIQPRNDGQQLQALITDPEYTQIHSIVDDIWQSRFPDEELSWKPLAMCQKPFQIKMENGRIVDLIVSKEVKNWEANMYKGIVSLFQLNVNAENALPSTLNILPSPHSDNAVFLTMEDSVSGETETLYEIRPIPEHQFDASQQSKHFHDWKQNGEIIEVLKHKNYTNHQQLPSYAYGFGDFYNGRIPATNRMSNIFSRDSTARAILLGHLERYTVVNSSIINTILVNPTLTDQQKAAVVSFIEADLQEIKSQDEKIENISEPVPLGNLVYSYNKPFSQDDQVRQNIRSHQRGQEQDYDNDADNEYSGAYDRFRKPRSLDRYSGNQNDYDEYYYTQDQPDINQSPENPLLPQTTGYEGKSIKKAGNLVKVAEKIAKKIGSELEDKERDHHERTLERFINLATIIRLMNFEELKQISEQLYTQAEEGVERATWSALRDAVAEAGTGPALLTIDSWIETEKIGDAEAAQVVSSMAKSARQPTLQYMKSFFKLTKKEKVLRQWPLNDTVLITFAHLARSVYFDSRFTESEYPVEAFGPYCTEEGKRFIREQVIPYYTEMLRKAVQRAETHKVHAYIFTLGKIADPAILAAYEPYLEGKEQASQFQRLLMLISLEKLVEVHPHLALAVLYRVYQNVAETPAVRIAAVFQIARSRPTAEILQFMAQNTNFDKNEHVNAAVKHTIEQLCELEDYQDSVSRDNAKAARPFLTKNTYGLNYGSNYLRSYFMDELNRHVKTYAHFYPSEDAYSPKGIRYTMGSSWNGLSRQDINIKALVSSVDQLITVGYSQTKKFNKEQKQQKEHAQQQGEHPWSSQNIAKLLDMKADEREQLEGFLSLDFSTPNSMFGFDNKTLNKLPQYIQEWEQDLRNGLKFDEHKMVQTKEMVLAVPTVMGFPFVFHYATPMLLKVQGEVMAAANPQFSQGSRVQQPDLLKIESEMRFTLSGKTQGRVMFVAPFEHQQYISGYDKHWQLNLPKIKTEIKVDWQQQELQVQIEPKEESKVKILHYRTWPYTAKVDVMNFEPLSSQTVQKNVKLIEPQNMQGFKTVVGQKSTGLALEVEIRHERKNIHVDLLRRIFTKNGVYDGLRELWEDSYIQNSEFDVTYLPEQSSINKITLRSKYDEEYRENPESRQGKYVLNEKTEPAQRQKELMKEVSAEIKNVKVIALDSTIQFHGEKNVQYLLTAAAAKSNVDPKSFVRICYKKSSEDQQIKDYETHFILRNKAENTNGMDLETSFQTEPQMDTEIEAVFGESQGELSKLKAKLQHRRSEERKRYLRELPMYQQCQQEMRHGNKALDACTKMNMIANLLDRAEIKIQHEKLSPEFEEAIQMIYDAGRVWALPQAYIKDKQSQLPENEILMKIKFHEDLEQFNATIQTPKQETIVKNIPVNELARQIVVPHPVFHLRARMLSHIFGTDSYREFCTVDKTRVSTFSNRTYDADISKQWTVMALYAPKLAREQGQNQQQKSLQKQLKEQLENYVVLVRESGDSQDKKEVKIVVSTPETGSQIVEIDMKPSRGEQAKAQVSINGKQVQVSQKQSQDAHKGYVQVYALPNGEVKVEIEDAFYVMYDGERARMTAVSDKLKDATRGLCGQFNDQEIEDFLTSENCMARKPQKFVMSYEVEGEQGKQVRQQFAGEDNQCVDKQQPLYVNVITGRDTTHGDSKQQYPSHSLSQGSQCLFHQTKYVQQNGQICFTTVPVPSCRSHCRAAELKNKNVGVHCVQQSNVADLWRNQIDNGNSPDFSAKKQHKTVQMPVPQSCSA